MNTEQSIIENNRLIAEFMGLEKPTLKVYSKVIITDNEDFKGIEGRFNGHTCESSVNITLKDGSSRWFDIGEFEVIDTTEYKYRTSWNWLMPVVEKIESLDNSGGDFDCALEICHGRTLVVAHHGEILIETNGTNKITATYNAIIEFIKWYNANK